MSDNKNRNTFQEKDLFEYFYYDETSPTCLRWAKTFGRKIKQDTVAGMVDGKSNIATIKGKHFATHRIIFKLFNPSFEVQNKTKFPCVKHVDGNKFNNKIENLLVPNSQNSQKIQMKQLKKQVKDLEAKLIELTK